MKAYEVRRISLESIPGAAAITSLVQGHDGAVYVGLTGAGHVLARVDPRSDRVEDLGRVFPERRGMIPVLDKIHNSLVRGPDGALYIGQGLNIDWHAAPAGCDLSVYGGGHLFRYDTGRGAFEDLGVQVPLNAIHGLAIDSARRVLYGYTIPDNHFFIHRLDDHSVEDKGRISTYASHNLVCGREGTVFGGYFGDVSWTGDPSAAPKKHRFYGTYLFRYRPAENKLVRTSELVVYGEEHDIFSNKGIDAWVCMRSGAIYGGTAIGGCIFAVTEATGTVGVLGKPVLGPRVSGMCEGPDGSVYITAGFPVMHLVRYFPGTGSFVDYGPVVENREMCYFHGIAVAQDGTVWVGETDSALPYVYRLQPRGT
jgi:hypothetical protein